MTARARSDLGAGGEGLSIVLPAFNEAANIRTAVESALAAAETLALDYEVIVVDDGSRDGTGHEVELLAKQHQPRVRLVTNETNRGYGAALRIGFEHARYGLVFFTDSDNQFDVSELEHFLPLTSECDIVVGFRTNRSDPVQRRVYSWFYNALIGLLFEIRVRDVNCAFKLMTREVVQKVTIESDNFFVNAELLAKARRLRFKIIEKGVHHYPRTAGKTSVKLSDVVHTLRTVVRMWRPIHRTRWIATEQMATKDLVVPSAAEVTSGSRTT